MRRNGRRPAGSALAAGAVCAALLSAGCAASPAGDAEARAAFARTNDPAEPFNRAVFDVNLAIDKALLRPLALLYREALPPLFRDFVRNALDNLRSPVILANDVLQGEFERAGRTAVRAAINSTLGLGGINDLAAEFGIERHDEDFGQTLAVAGLGEGPFLMLPILGPSNPRDAAGLVVDALLDPLTWLDSARAFSLARPGADALDRRARADEALQELERTSLDMYAAARSLYRQQRRDDIRNGRPADLDSLPDISIPDDDPPE